MEQLQSLDGLKPKGPSLKVGPESPVTVQSVSEFLRSHGYSLNSTHEGDFRLSGWSVKGWVSELCVLVDHAKCYNKPSQCPVRVTLPTTAGELLRALRQIGSNQGLLISSGFHYHPISPFRFDS